MESRINSLSIVAPVYNEEENLPELYRKIKEITKTLPVTTEVILVNDGSKDNSLKILEQLAKDDDSVKVVSFMRNYGQTAALAAGIDHASGDVVVFLDADLQNDPADIPAMLAKLSEGYDVVSGWRSKRKDTFINRKLPSMIANAIISKVTGVHLHDYGCTLKAYRAEYLKGFRLYGEMHRFLPAYAAQSGAKIIEMPVNHHPRIHGTSKYGIERTIKVMLDLMTVKFLGSYFHKPIYLFGSVGAALIASSFALLTVLIYRKLSIGASLIESPLLLMSVMFVILGVQSIFLGLISELLVRIYHESQDKSTYRIAKTCNLKVKN